jgi:predicted N-acyltransferase
MPVKVINQIKETSWNQWDNLGIPFLSYEFFLALEESQSIGGESGWQPLYLEAPNKSLLYSFIKSHSYGEYIFDWDWAHFYKTHNIPYYPKLTSMIPFTSATSPHFLGEASTNVMETYEEYYAENPFSSSHFLFLPESEISFFESFGYITRESFQYHFYNDGYQTFDDFLSKLKAKKSKQIKKERTFLENISFHQYSGDDLSLEHASEMYQFYLSTIIKKRAIPYLKESFFKKIFEKLKHCICYIQGKKEGIAIAGALYFYSSDRLYGRYWGTIEEIPNLHFELCYYQGIEFCISKKISVFEAGAQGEHKIARGFRPVKTYSAHKLKNPNIHEAIKKYVRNETLGIDDLFPQLNSRLPFK